MLKVDMHGSYQVLGEQQQLVEAAHALELNLDLDLDVRIHVFELTIRALGVPLMSL